MRRRARKHGFTLVELMAAVAVASIALAATAAAVTTGAQLSRTSAETRASMRAAATMMERVRSTPYSQIADTFNNTTQTLSTLATAESSGTASVTVADVPTGSSRWGVKHVTVVARWKGVNGDTSRTFVTWICDRTAGSSLSGASTLPAN